MAPINTVALFAVAAAIIACAGTAIVRAYAIRRALLDIPNPRSSHTNPTPRGGGLAIVLVVLAATIVLDLRDSLDTAVTIALVGGGGMIAFVGWLDDHQSLGARWRALTHFSAAILAVYLIGVPDTLSVGSRELYMGPAYDVLAVLGLVWLTNLFNFMDGIDGIAAVEAAVVSGAGGGLLLFAGDHATATLALVISGASIGFLAWNWAPAKIFMGDVGSGFLGFALGVLVVAGISADLVSLGVWVVLLGVFLFDATVTLVRRLGREPFYVAHRRHAYQRAVQAGWSHRRVTTAVLLINLVLAALALIAWRDTKRVPFVLLGASALLFSVYLYVERRMPMWADVRHHESLGESRDV